MWLDTPHGQVCSNKPANATGGFYIRMGEYAESEGRGALLNTLQDKM
jgi:hypothetical protein